MGKGFPWWPSGRGGEEAWALIALLADLGVVEITLRGSCLQGWDLCVLQRKSLAILVGVVRFLNW